MGGTVEELNHGWTQMDTDRESNIQHSSDQVGQTNPSDLSDPSNRTFPDQRLTTNDDQLCGESGSQLAPFGFTQEGGYR